MTHTIALLNNNIDLILSALRIDFNETSNRFFFSCPIHQSDNYSSLTIYKSGEWRCFTKGCHLNAERGIVGFVMSYLRCDKEKALEFCLNACNLKREIVHRKRIPQKEISVDRSLILPYVDPNLEFYLRRGYSLDILDKYDIFLCKKRNHHL